MKRNGLKNTGGLNTNYIKRGSGGINRVGRITRERIERKKQWEKDNPPMVSPDGSKFYHCHICKYFGEPDSISYVSYDRYVLEHIIPKGRLSLDESQQDSNLAPAHSSCNLVKGSALLEDMITSPMTGKPNPHAL